MGDPTGAGKDSTTMWMPTEQEFRLLKMQGLLTMALIFGARVVPPLQPHARLIGIVAAVLYVGFGLAVIAWHALAGYLPFSPATPGPMHVPPARETQHDRRPLPNHPHA